MNLSEEVWAVINTSVKMPEESKKSLHINIMRLVEQARKSPVGQRHGVTIMTQEASQAGDNPATPGSARPKSI